MAGIEDGNSIKRVLNIQYSIHFDNSEDSSQSERSTSNEPVKNFSSNIVEDVKSLSDSKLANDGYEVGFAEDFNLKIGKAASLAPVSLSDFQ